MLIEAAAASVYPIDWKIRSGARQKDFPLTLPAILGKDVSGIVCAVGKSVRTFKAGDRVLAVAEATYAELVVVEGSVLTHLPEGLDLVDAAASSRRSDGRSAREPGGSCSTRADLDCQRGARKRGPRRRAQREEAGRAVIAGVRARQLPQARSLGVSDTVAIDDDDAIASLAMVDAVADTVGGETAAKLFSKVKNGGTFGYASVLPDGVAEAPGVKVTRVFFCASQCLEGPRVADDIHR